MKMDASWKYLFTAGAFGLIHCSSQLCELDKEKCPPTISELTNNQSISFKSDTTVQFTFNNVGLDEPCFARLKQFQNNSVSGMPIEPNTEECSNGYPCLDLKIDCNEMQDLCSVNIQGKDLLQNKFASGPVWLVVNQPPRSLGKTPSLDIQDPAKFGPWSQVMLPTITEGGVTYMLGRLGDIQILNKIIYLSRYYIGSGGFEFSDIIFGSKDNLWQVTAPVLSQSSPAYAYALSDTYIWTARKTADPTKTTYTIKQYGLPPAASVASVDPSALEPSNKVALTRLVPAADSTRLFALGADNAIYTASLMAQKIPAMFDKLAVPSPQVTTLLPLSGSSLLTFAPGAVHRYDQAGGSWNDTDLSAQFSTSGLVSAGTGDVTKDGKPDIVLWNGTQFLFYKNKGDNNFSSFSGSLNVPPTSVIKAIAIGDVDGVGGNDIAIMTTKEVWVALQQ